MNVQQNAGVGLDGGYARSTEERCVVRVVDGCLDKPVSFCSRSLEGKCLSRSDSITIMLNSNMRSRHTEFVTGPNVSSKRFTSPVRTKIFALGT